MLVSMYTNDFLAGRSIHSTVTICTSWHASDASM